MYKFPEGILSAVPSFIHGGINPSPPGPSHEGSPHAPASVASTLTSAAPLLRLLMHEDLIASSAVAVAPLVVPSANVASPPAPSLNVSISTSVGGAILPVAAIALVSIIRPAEPFKLPPIADAKAYLNLTSIIQY